MTDFETKETAETALDLAGHLSQSLIDFIEGQPINISIAHHDTVKLFACLVCASLYHKVIVKEKLNDIDPDHLKEVIHGMLDQFIDDPDIELSKHIKH
tara:strand:+ start:475 stop:768 length:294 start_codon:yes stop_codon:yes gene_type:complete